MKSAVVAFLASVSAAVSAYAKTPRNVRPGASGATRNQLMKPKDETATKASVPSRRHILLGGTTLAAASALSASATTKVAQASTVGV
jgi:hypothetical protein